MIGVMVHKHETLTDQEEAAKKAFMAKLEKQARKTKDKVIIAMIGLIGSGKSTVAKELAKHIGATVVEGDTIRVELRKQGARYERARAIAEEVALRLVEESNNAILDSDFIDAKKRASLREKARKAGVRVIFLCTYADIDVMIGRIITANYHGHVDDFFGGASTKWGGSEQSRGAVVKLREMYRRLPQHYRWQNKGGGKWVIKKPPCAVLADIDTTSLEEWKREVKKVAKQLIVL
ncbi:MAG: ATP-binding protein [bacterium]